MKMMWHTLLVGIATFTQTVQGTEMAQKAARVWTYSGQEARDYFEDIARMRITMFREFPYLYNGSFEYEKEYLEAYFKSLNAKILLVFDTNNEIVGFSNSIPLAEELDEIKAPFKEHGLDLNHYLYIGEVMLKEEYRGKGFARQFFTYHENNARTNGYDYTVFMTVDRTEDDLDKPKDYVSPDAIWNHFGYTKDKNLSITMDWPSVDQSRDSKNTLSIWWKRVK